MDESVLEKKSSSKIPGASFSSKLDWESFIMSIVKSASKSNGFLTCSMKFLSPELVQCLRLSAYYNEIFNSAILFKIYHLNKNQLSN